MTPDKGVQPRLTRLEKKVSDTKKALDAVNQTVPMPTTGPTMWTSEAIQDHFQEMEAEMWQLRQKVDQQNVSLSIVASWSDVMFQQIHSLQEQLYHNTSRHMQNKLIIGGIKQTTHENCKTAAIKFFKDKLSLTIAPKDVWYGYRKGSSTTRTVDGQRG